MEYYLELTAAALVKTRVKVSEAENLSDAEHQAIAIATSRQEWQQCTIDKSSIRVTFAVMVTDENYTELLKDHSTFMGKLSPE